MSHVRKLVTGAVLGLCACCMPALGAPPPLPADGSPPSPADMLVAYGALETWVRAWSVPEQASPSFELPRAAGACVLLRYSGETIARGIAVADQVTGPDSGDPAVLALAAREALAQAAKRLPVPNDALRDQALKALGAEIAISLELAGAFTPIEPAIWAEVDRTLQPGLDGVAANITAMQHDGDRLVTLKFIPAAFPSSMLTIGMPPSRALAGVCAQAIGPGGPADALDEPKAVREKHKLRMYRFRASQVVEGAPSAPPVFLYRGAKIAVPDDVSSADDLLDFGGAVAHHIARAHWWNTDGLARVMDVNSMEELLAQWALGEWCNYLESTGRGQRAPARPRTPNDPSLNDMFPENGSKSPTIIGLHVLGLVDGWQRPSSKPKYLDPIGALLLRCAPHLDSAFDVSGGFSDAVPVSEHGLLSLALVAHAQEQARRGTDRGRIATANAAVRKAFAETPSGKLASHMPWLGWAELRLLERGEPIPAATALRQMRSDIWNHQLSLADAGRDRQDMIGGIVFTLGVKEGAAPAYPTWQCVRPLTFIATMLRDPRLTEPHERPRELARLLSALRYLRQLQVDEASAWMYPEPKKAIGGIRAAVWSPDLPPDASALTLLCLVETLKSLDALAQEAQTAQPAK